MREDTRHDYKRGFTDGLSKLEQKIVWAAERGKPLKIGDDLFWIKTRGHICRSAWMCFWKRLDVDSRRYGRRYCV